MYDHEAFLNTLSLSPPMQANPLSDPYNSQSDSNSSPSNMSQGLPTSDWSNLVPLDASDVNPPWPPGSYPMPSSARFDGIYHDNYPHHHQPHLVSPPGSSELSTQHNSEADDTQDGEALRTLKQMAQAQLARPGVHPLLVVSQLVEAYLTVLQRSGPVHPVQAWTEGSRSYKQNNSVLPMEGYPPSNPSLFESTPHLSSPPAFSTSTLHTPQQPSWAETADVPITSNSPPTSDGLVDDYHLYDLSQPNLHTFYSQPMATMSAFPSPSILPPLASTTERPTIPTMSHLAPSDSVVLERASTGSDLEEIQPPPASRQSSRLFRGHNKSSTVSTENKKKARHPKKKPASQIPAKRHPCEYPGCKKTYCTLRDRNRHARSKHEPMAPNPAARCGRCKKQLSRTDSCRRHERSDNGCDWHLASLGEESGEESED